MEVGETWAYRAKGRDPLVEVVVTQIGTRRPPRVRIRFVDDSFEGREEWVPPGRLKVEWDQAERWLAHEARWTAVEERWPHHDDVELRACGVVMDAAATNPIDSLYNHTHGGALVIPDVDSVLTACDMTRAMLLADPVSFENEDGSVVVPWETARDIALLLARRHADQIVEHVAREEASNRRDAIYGRYYGRREHEYFSPETCARFAAEESRVHDVVRQWCGAEAVDRHDELVALRAEVRRLGNLVEQAVTSLKLAGRKKDAAAIERDLGVSVELVRQAASAHQDR